MNMIGFTVEEKGRKTTVSLDCLVRRKHEGILETSVYRKATHMDQCLAYSPNHPPQHKLKYGEVIIT